MKQKNSSTLLLLLVAGFLAWSIRSPTEQTEPPPTPTRAGLATILEAFAYNLEADGRLDLPILQTTNQVGEAINAFGARSTLGQAYRSTFAPEFDELGRRLKRALDVADRPRELTPARRAAAAEALRGFAGGL